MLKITDIAELDVEEIHFDDYVPLSVEWGKTRSRVPHYWRTGNFHTSLLEVGVEPTSGRLCSLTLTLADQVSLCAAEQTLAHVPQRAGIPVCELDWSAGGRIDEAADFKVCLGETHLLIDFLSPSRVSSAVTTKRLRFGLDDNNDLCAVEVIALSAHEIAHLKTALGFRGEERRMDEKVEWIEVWIDSPSQGNYILLLKSIGPNKLVIVDPQKNNEVVTTFDNYEDAVHWLNEDEYDLVEGRWTPAD